MSVPVAGSKLVKRPLASDGDEFQAYRNPRLIVKFGFHLKLDRKSTRLNSSHANISYAVFCLKKKTFVRAFVATSKNAIAVTIPPTGRSWIWWVSLSRGERMVCVHVSWRSASAVSSQSQTLGH